MNVYLPVDVDVDVVDVDVDTIVVVAALDLIVDLSDVVAVVFSKEVNEALAVAVLTVFDSFVVRVVLDFIVILRSTVLAIFLVLTAVSLVVGTVDISPNIVTFGGLDSDGNIFAGVGLCSLVVVSSDTSSGEVGNSSGRVDNISGALTFIVVIVVGFVKGSVEPNPPRVELKRSVEAALRVERSSVVFTASHWIFAPSAKSTSWKQKSFPKSSSSNFK